MGGQAAINLLSEFSNAPEYVRAIPTLDIVHEVLFLTSILTSHNLIEEEINPNFGSTRLFASVAGWKNVYISKLETREVIKKALSVKKDFGDIDLGIRLKKDKTLQDIVNCLNRNKDKYASKIIGNELTIALKLDMNPTKAIQVDLIDISEDEMYHQVNQFASMLDMSIGIKGVIRDLLIRSIVATEPIKSEWISTLRESVFTTDVYKTFYAKYKDKGVVDIAFRYSLAKEGLSTKITWLVDDVKKSYSKAGIKFDYLHDFIFDDINKPLSWHRVKDITAWLGFDDVDDINHSIKLVEKIASYDAERKRQVWNRYEELLKTKLPSATRTIAQISVDEAQLASDYIKQHAHIDV
jgi:hypothetical protein